MGKAPRVTRALAGMGVKNGTELRPHGPTARALAAIAALGGGDILITDADLARAEHKDVVVIIDGPTMRVVLVDR
jgi:hypothetical protein